MTHAEKIAHAQELKQGGVSMAEIARRLGVVHSTVWKWLHPEVAREWNRRENMRRASAKRAEERRLDAPPCVECGRPRTRACARSGYVRCNDCRLAAVRAQRDARRSEIRRLWAEGRTRREIAAVLGSTPSSIGVEITRMRAEGIDVPHRYNIDPSGRRLAA